MKRMGLGGGQEERSGAWCSARARSRDAGVHARRTSETRGPVISQMMLVAETRSVIICDGVISDISILQPATVCSHVSFANALSTANCNNLGIVCIL